MNEKDSPRGKRAKEDLGFGTWDLAAVGYASAVSGLELVAKLSELRLGDLTADAKSQIPSAKSPDVGVSHSDGVNS